MFDRYSKFLLYMCVRILGFNAMCVDLARYGLVGSRTEVPHGWLNGHGVCAHTSMMVFDAQADAQSCSSVLEKTDCSIV